MRGRAAIVVPALMALALTAVACGGGSDAGSPTATASGFTGTRPSSTGVLAIVSPTDGEVVHGSTVDLKIDLKGAKIVSLTSTDLKPDEGHIHVILDDQLVSMTTGTELKIPNVAPGHHLIRVEFVATDHGPFDPRVLALVSFEVKG
jgi:hypothetical protein